MYNDNLKDAKYTLKNKRVASTQHAVLFVGGTCDYLLTPTGE